MKNKIEDLRDHLFETIEMLKDPDKPMDIDRARAVSDVAKVIVDSAKVEVDFVKATGSVRTTGFLPAVEMPGRAQAKRLGEGTPSRRCTNCTAVTAADPCETCGTPWKRGE